LLQSTQDITTRSWRFFGTAGFWLGRSYWNWNCCWSEIQPTAIFAVDTGHHKKLTIFWNCWILTGQILLELSLKWDTTDSNCCSRHGTSRQEADDFLELLDSDCADHTGTVARSYWNCRWSEIQPTAIVAVDTGHRVGPTDRRRCCSDCVNVPVMSFLPETWQQTALVTVPSEWVCSFLTAHQHKKAI